MSKFKVGDTVTIGCDSTNEVYTICSVDDTKLYCNTFTSPSGHTGAWEDEGLTLVEPYTTEEQQHNPVSKPSHYNVADGIECITYIKQVLGNEGFVAYCRGNQIKYQHRAMYKGNPIEDLEKAHQYNAWAIETLKELPKP